MTISMCYAILQLFSCLKFITWGLAKNCVSCKTVLILLFLRILTKRDLSRQEERGRNLLWHVLYIKMLRSYF